jgi:hypothetical protein
MTKVTAIVSKTTNRVSLVQGNEYEVIGIELLDYRIFDESGEPALFPKSYFQDEEVAPPPDWICRKYDDDEYEYNLPQFSDRGFFEDYADGVKEAVDAMEAFRRNQMKAKEQ